MEVRSQQPVDVLLRRRRHCASTFQYNPYTKTRERLGAEDP